MKASQKIALEMSTKREALNALLSVDELDDAQRSEMGVLTTRMQELETEARAAIGFGSLMKPQGQSICRL